MNIKATLNRVLAERTGYEVRRAGTTWVPPGHFYSPIVNRDELWHDRRRVFDRARPVHDINLNEPGQLNIVSEFRDYYSKVPFPESKSTENLYYYDNGFYSYGDAIVLFCMLYHFKPQRVIEFGSGFSSCAILDTKRLFLPNMQCLFIDPYPQRLRELLGSPCVEAPIIEARAQDAIGLPEMKENDVVFIDSTHVSKAGSDVNYHLFEFLPQLPVGVLIHFHDVFYPFEYPESWFFDENRSWNENYLLRAFLMGNQNYEIVFFNDFMNWKHHDLTVQALPLFGKNPGGALWLRKLRSARTAQPEPPPL
jgi:hypothetical protein